MSTSLVGYMVIYERWIEETNVHNCDHKFSRTYGHICAPSIDLLFANGHNLYELLTVKSIRVLSHVYCTQAIFLLSTDHFSEFFFLLLLYFHFLPITIV